MKFTQFRGQLHLATIFNALCASCVSVDNWLFTSAISLIYKDHKHRGVAQSTGIDEWIVWNRHWPASLCNTSLTAATGRLFFVFATPEMSSTVQA